MADNVLPLAQKRILSSKAGRLVIASTPRLPEFGIHEQFLHSDQRYYFLTCQSCALEQRLTWLENVDQERRTHAQAPQNSHGE